MNWKNNWRKFYHYVKRNGIKAAYYNLKERYEIGKKMPLHFNGLSEEILIEQSKRVWEKEILFSIVVPTYETNPIFLRAMIESVLNQSYGKFELILADASTTTLVKIEVEKFQDQRIRYVKLAENKGISENTNVAIDMAKGEYIGLLDHDDFLELNTLYLLAEYIECNQKKNNIVKMLYTNEDKCDEWGNNFFEYHKKENCDLEMLLSNNYICHFLVIEAELMKKLKLRKEYDGAQDFDLALRAAYQLRNNRAQIIHIARCLYHWRCHENSTAFNPESKAYAYEAGKRVVEDFMKEKGWQGKVFHAKHLGFYEVEYTPRLLEQRQDIGAVGGCLIDYKNKIIGGNYTLAGRVKYAGVHKEYSGYMKRATLRQEAWAVDIRLMKIRLELIPLMMKLSLGRYLVDNEGRIILCKKITESEIAEASIEICAAIRNEGYGILWEPKWKEKMKRGHQYGSNRNYTKL